MPNSDEPITSTDPTVLVAPPAPPPPGEAPTMPQPAAKTPGKAAEQKGVKPAATKPNTPGASSLLSEDALAKAAKLEELRKAQEEDDGVWDDEPEDPHYVDNDDNDATANDRAVENDAQDREADNVKPLSTATPVPVPTEADEEQTKKDQEALRELFRKGAAKQGEKTGFNAGRAEADREEEERRLKEAARLKAENELRQQKEQKRQEEKRLADESLEAEAKANAMEKAKQPFWKAAKAILGDGFAKEGKVSDTDKAAIREAFNDPNVLAGFKQIQISLAQKGHKKFTEIASEVTAFSEDKSLYPSLKTKNASGDALEIKDVSPGMLVCTNIPGVIPMEYIDPATKQKTFASIITEALMLFGHEKIKIAGHFVPDEHGNLQPVLEYDANAGDDKAPARIRERKVLNHIIQCLFDKGFTEVKVFAKLHQNAYQLNKDHTALVAKDGHMVWDPGFASTLNEFKHKLTDLSVPITTIERIRGSFDEKHEKNDGVDPLFCVQPDRDNKRVNESMMVGMIFKPKQEDDAELNSAILEELPLPAIDSVVNFNTEDNDLSPHSLVTLETIEDDTSWGLAADMSRKGPKAFKDPKTIYKKESLDDLPTLKKDRQAHGRKLYILAANQFLTVESKSLTESQKAALSKLKDIIRKSQIDKNGRMPLLPQKIDEHSFDGFRKANPFVDALNEVIKTQVNADVSNGLAKAWLDALDGWRGSQEFKTFKGHLLLTSKKLESKEGFLSPKSQASESVLPAGSPLPLKPADKSTNTPGSKNEKKADKHPALMTAAELRKLSAKPTGGGGCDPLHVLFAAWGCEESGGYTLVNNHKNLTNIEIGRRRLLGNTQVVTEKLLSSKRVFTVVVEGADKERAPEEIELVDMAPSKALPRMVGNMFKFLDTCDQLFPAQTLEQKQSANVGSPQKTSQQGSNFRSPQKPPRQGSTVLDAETGCPISAGALGQVFAFMKFKKMQIENRNLKTKNYKDWDIADKTQHIMFSHFIKEADNLLKCQSKNNAKAKVEQSLIEEAGRAILEFHDAQKTLAERHAGQNQGVNWKPIETELQTAQNKVRIACNKMKARTGWHKFRAICLVLGGIALVAGGVALLAMSFGGLAPLSAGLATLGITVSMSVLTTTAQVVGGAAVVGGLLTIPAYRYGLFATKSPIHKFAEQVEENVERCAVKAPSL